MPALRLVNPDAAGSALQLRECACGGVGTLSAMELVLFNELYIAQLQERGQRPVKTPTDSPEMPYPKGITISTIWVNQADGDLKTDKRQRVKLSSRSA